MAKLTRERIDAEHFVARYAQGRLSDADQEAFEEFCLMNPDVAEQVRTDRALIDGMRAIDATRKPQIPRVAFFALAASIAIVAVGVGFWMRSGSDASGGVLYRADASLPAAASRQIAATRRVVLLRDSSSLSISVPANATALPLAIEPGVTRGAATLRIRLAEEADGRWSERGTIDAVAVPPGAEATIDVTVDLTTLTSTHLRIFLEAQDGRTDEFELRIVRSPAT